MKIKIMLFLLFPICLYSQTVTSEFSEQPVTMNEIWIMDDTSYKIEGTGLLEGKVFIVRALWDRMPGETDYNEALRIAQFALVKGYRNNAKGIRFYDQFAQVDMEHIGVALIYKDTFEDKGYRFMFSTDDVLGENLTEGEIAPPLALKDEISISNLGNEYWNMIYNNQANKIYDNFIEEVQNQISEEQFIASFVRINEYVQPLTLQGFSHFVFLGNNHLGRMFNYMYWVEKEGAKGFLTLTVLDLGDSSNVIGVNVVANSFFK